MNRLPLPIQQDSDVTHMSQTAGYRLATFEVFNWGTFDGQVHSISPHGTTCLLVGENGAGKSTLVDAMLTLLVRPGVRNYNVAAGAGKKERDGVSGDRVTQLLGILDELAAQTEFDAMDDARHDYEASQLRLEKQTLESSNDQLVHLKSKLAALDAEVEGLDAERDRFVGERSRLDCEVTTHSNTLTRVDKSIAAATADGRLARLHLQFEEIDSLCGERKLGLENLSVLPRDIADELSAKVTEVEARIDPVRNDLTKAMSRLIQKFPVFETELDSTPQALPSFEALAERINKDDLPRHERRYWCPGREPRPHKTILAQVTGTSEPHLSEVDAGFL